MPRTIYKYALGNSGTTTLELPVGYHILRFGPDPKDNLCIWAEVDKDYELTELVNIQFFGTGHPVQDKPKCFIGSCVQGPFVWHAYHFLNDPAVAAPIITPRTRSRLNFDA